MLKQDILEDEEPGQAINGIMTRQQADAATPAAQEDNTSANYLPLARPHSNSHLLDEQQKGVIMAWERNVIY